MTIKFPIMIIITFHNLNIITEFLKYIIPIQLFRLAIDREIRARILGNLTILINNHSFRHENVYCFDYIVLKNVKII